ncbi:ABC transporter ATP-binding protein [Agrobacterium tumefaciens]|uniref:ABC transporter ATP-binding protein n=1 Tax=Agrobacterium tumefaciens TaxID=358 RepID=UPI0012B9F606|nr:ABC transporter ATP-binding protein [Agrobacterium tumefaciens]MQB07215.1 ABC transporter ATP-binding protein [Agrobacterium tumefaciens]
MAYLDLFRRMWGIAAGSRHLILSFYGLHIFATICELLYPFVFLKIVNAVQLEAKDNIIPVVVYWLLVWGLLFLGFNLFHRIGRYIEFHVAYRAKQRFIRTSYETLLRQPVAWHQSHHSGDIINRINISSLALFSFITMQFVYIEFAVMFLGSLIALYLFIPEISLGAFVMATVALLLIRYFDGRLARWYRTINSVSHRISSTLLDLLPKVVTIIAYRAASYTSERLERSLGQGYAPTMRANGIVNAAKWFCVTMLMTAMQILSVLYYIVSELSRNGTVLAGNVTAVYQYVDRFTNTFRSFSQEYQKIIQWNIDMEALADLRNEHVATEAQIDTHSFQTVAIEKLEFTRNTKDSSLMCSLSFESGEKVALVGESGCGKSSLLLLLAGIHTPDTVKVTIDGQQHDSLSVLSSMALLVPQNPEVFEDTIQENILLGAANDLEDLERALSCSTFDEVLLRQPEGLKTEMRENGSSLSGGQKQRLALARGVFYASAFEILMMDEPTSSVDAANELKIYERILSGFPNKTFLVATHNIELTRLFDKIIVMDKGRIVDIGSYSEVSKNSEIFRRLKDGKSPTESQVLL